MNQKLWYSLAVLALALALLTACGEKMTPVPPQPAALPQTNMAYELADASGVEVHDFELEDGEVRTWNDRPVVAPLAGIIALPEGDGPHPLVVIVHGARRIDSIRDKVYAGFEYLVRQLAAEGCAAMSINVNVEYTEEFGESLGGSWAYSIFQQHLALLEKANAGENAGHGVDLTGKLGLDQIHVMGHSRGGELADIFVRKDQAAGLERIHSILRIASSVLSYDEPEDAPHLDIPTGIILPEFDGDLVTPFGQQVFDEILMEAQNKSFSSVVYLRGANHNFFNRAVVNDDRISGFGEVAQTSEETWLTREEQEDFLMRYAAAFLGLAMGAKEPWGAFSPLEPQPVSMFGYAVIASTYLPGVRRVLAPRAGTASGSATSEVCVQRGLLEGLFNHPSVINRRDGQLTLTALTWNGEDGTATFTPAVNNFSGADAMSLYVAVDSSNELNPQGKNQAFSVALIDSSGVRRSVIIPAGTSALAWYPGEVFETEEWDGSTMRTWLGFMPLGELRIPLRLFDGIDLDSILSIEIVFDQTATGAVMLEGIYLR